MTKAGDESYTVRHGASEDGYPTSKDFDNLSEAILYAVDRSQTNRCRPVLVIKRLVIAQFDEAFGEDEIEEPKPKEQKRCHCGDLAWGSNGACGISGCSNVPA
jgi:hypothetical protein